MSYCNCVQSAAFLERKLDARPHMSGQLEDVGTNFLIDTGGAISCISEEKYRSLPRYWQLPVVPKDLALSLSSASSHNMSIVGRYNIRLWVLYLTIVRPMYVLSGLSRQKIILEIHFIKEQLLVIDSGNVKVSKLNALLPEEVCALYPALCYRAAPNGHVPH